jgi:hypothetical protein
MDSYSAGWPDNPVTHHACTRHGEMTGRDNLHTIEDSICYYYTTKCDTVEDGVTEHAMEGNPGGGGG